tara:strand:+ start:269 stop:664 length:396 start_codon:yes stop_codon:yes gene_type:complete
MLELASNYLTSAILSIMIFFSFVVAPVIFTNLDEENARKFIRKIFPYYYILNLALGSFITAIYVILKTYNLNFFLILIVSILFAISNFILMPLINKFKDEKKDKQFKYLHFLSVIINFVQILILLIILIKI